VMRLPESDKISYKREKMYADLAVAMGGRVAEELVFGHAKVSSGASSDIQYATKLARAMVAEWGLSDELGPVHYGSDQQEVFLGHSFSQSGNISSATQAKVDAEIRRIVTEAHLQATDILTRERESLNLLAEALLEYETIKALLRGEQIHRPDPSELRKKSVRGSLPTSRKPADGDGDNATL
jgi:cell division protease FtsH